MDVETDNDGGRVLNGGKTPFAMENTLSAFGLAVDGLRLSPNPAEGVGTDEREEVGDDVEAIALNSDADD